MATDEQRTALLAVPCSWCGARPGETCYVRVGGDVLDSEGGKRRPRFSLLTTLDGGCHDARWRRALDQSAPVVTGAVLERTERPDSELVGAAARPW